MYGSVASVINNKVNPTDLTVVAELTSPDSTTDIACHETGHALGLKHDSNTSCTNTTTPEGYSSHEVTDHINANY